MQAEQLVKQPDNVSVEILNLVVPFKDFNNATIRDSGTHSKIECYRGKQKAGNVGVAAIGSGAWAQGSIHAEIETYDFKAIYDVYHLDEKTSANYWFVTYQKEQSHDQLVQTALDSKKINAKVDLNFILQGNDYGITSVYVYYQVIRLVIDGVTQDYVVTNPQSSGAGTPSGDPYPGEFQPIDAKTNTLELCESSSIRETIMPEINGNTGIPIEITLRSIAASTGYVCALADKPDNIWIDGEATHVIPGSIPGQPGKLIFTLIGVGECMGDVVFKYVRPWNLNDIAEIVRYQIRIKK